MVVLKQKSGNLEILRRFIQVVFVLYVFLVSLGQSFNWEIGESLHAICPFGAIETFYTWVTTGKFIHHTGPANAIIALGLLFTLVLGGAFFCGWICPFGAVQEFFGNIGRKIFKKKYDNIIPSKLDKLLSYFKYFFLAFILYQTARSYELIFENLDPYYTFFNIWSDEIAVTGYISLALFLGLSLIKEKPFCRYACPLGAINGIFNKFSLFNIRRDSSTCINCGACDRACPVGIDVSRADRLDDTRCIRCMKCAEACPVNSDVKDTLKMKFLNSPKNNKRFVIILFTAFFLPIIFAVATGNFIKEIEEENSYNTPDEIRGSYTMSEIVENYDITADEIIYIYNLDENINLDSKIKDITENNGFSTDAFRLILENFPTPTNELGEYLPRKYQNSISLKDLLLDSQPGVIAKFFVEEEIVDESGSEIEIKRNTMLVEVKDIVKDYNDFLQTFNISEEEPLNSNFKELIPKYNLDMEKVKEYINKNLK